MSWRLTWIALLMAALFAVAPGCLAAQQAADDRTYAAAQKALAAGDYEQARKSFAELSRANPGIAELHATLGAILFQQGQYPAALKEVTEAKRLKPALPKLDGLIAMSLAEMGQYVEALPSLVQTFRTAEDEPVKRLSGLQLERAYTVLHQDREAVEVAIEMQRLFPTDPEVLYHNERIFGNFAYLTVQKLVQVAPDSIWRYQAQAEALESQGSHEAAIAEYRKVLKLNPAHRGIHYRIGRCLRERARDSHQASDLTEAMQEFMAELALDRGNANAAYEVGELHRLAGELEPARIYFELALHGYPDFPEANLGLGTVLASQHQPEAALIHLQQALKADPNDEATWYRVAQIERSLGHAQQQQQALQRFKELHNAAPTSLQQPANDVSRQEISSGTEP